MNYKKTLIFILVSLFLTLGYYAYQMYDFAKGVQADINNGINHFPKEIKFSEKIESGTWVHEKDSLATIRINEYLWTFEYNARITDSTDIYNYTIYGNKDSKNLTLTNQTDTLKYEIEYLTKKDLTIIYLPKGNYHNYKRIENKR